MIVRVRRGSGAYLLYGPREAGFKQQCRAAELPLPSSFLESVQGLSLFLALGAGDGLGHGVYDTYLYIICVYISHLYVYVCVCITSTVSYSASSLLCADLYVDGLFSSVAAYVMGGCSYCVLYLLSLCIVQIVA